MKYLMIVLIFAVSFTSVAQEKRSNLEIKHTSKHGYSMSVYDFSPEMKLFMKKRGLHGGGPTWIVLIETVLKTESPSTLRWVELNDEASKVQVKSKNMYSIIKVQSIVKKLMSNRKFLLKYVGLAKKTGRLE